MKVSILYFVFFLLSVVHLSSCAYSDPTKLPYCNNVCPSEYNSICAGNGSCLKVFNNECLLEAYNCRGPYEDIFHEVDFSYCNELKHKFCF